MAICPNCKNEIDIVIVKVQEVNCYEAQLERDSKTMDYSQQIESAEFNPIEYYCPECKKQLPINGDDQAIKFLKPKVGKGEI